MENVHFRSTIDIEPAGGSPPTFDDLVWEIVDWIRGKEGPSANLKAPWALRQGTRSQFSASVARRKRGPLRAVIPPMTHLRTLNQ